MLHDSQYLKVLHLAAVGCFMQFAQVGFGLIGMPPVFLQAVHPGAGYESQRESIQFVPL